MKKMFKIIALIAAFIVELLELFSPAPVAA
jgi:hypothetical protein